MTYLIKYPGNKAGEKFVVPESVKTIDSRAFREAKNLKEVIFHGKNFHFEYVED